MDENKNTGEDLRAKDGFSVSYYVDRGDDGNNYDVIFTAHKPCEVLSVSEVHRAAGTDAGSVTMNLEKLTSGQAKNSGVALLNTAFNLKSTVDTPVFKIGTDFVTTNNARQLKKGDRLVLKNSGTLTAVRGLAVTCYFKPLGKGEYE